MPEEDFHIGSAVLDASSTFDGRQLAGIYNEAIVLCGVDDATYVNILRNVLRLIVNHQKHRK